MRPRSSPNRGACVGLRHFKRLRSWRMAQKVLVCACACACACVGAFYNLRTLCCGGSEGVGVCLCVCVCVCVCVYGGFLHF